MGAMHGSGIFPAGMVGSGLFPAGMVGGRSKKSFKVGKIGKNTFRKAGKTAKRASQITSAGLRMMGEDDAADKLDQATLIAKSGGTKGGMVRRRRMMRR